MRSRLTAYTVVRRRAEIGIRMALGAAPASVIGLVLTRVATLVAVGLLVGASMSFWASILVGSLLYEIQPHDPLTLLGAATTTRRRSRRRWLRTGMSRFAGRPGRSAQPNALKSGAAFPKSEQRRKEMVTTIGALPRRVGDVPAEDQRGGEGSANAPERRRLAANRSIKRAN